MKKTIIAMFDNSSIILPNQAETNQYIIDSIKPNPKFQFFEFDTIELKEHIKTIQMHQINHIQNAIKQSSVSSN